MATKDDLPKVSADVELLWSNGAATADKVTLTVHQLDQMLSAHFKTQSALYALTSAVFALSIEDHSEARRLASEALKMTNTSLADLNASMNSVKVSYAHSKALFRDEK